MSTPAPPTSDDAEAAWTTAEVAAFLRLKKGSSVIALVRSGRLPAVQLGKRYRFAPSAVRAFLNGPEPPRVERRGRGMPEWMRGVPKVIRR